MQKIKFWNLWEHPLYEIWEFTFNELLGSTSLKSKIKKKMYSFKLLKILWCIFVFWVDTYIVKSIVVPPVYDPPLINSLYQSQYTYIVKSIVVPPVYDPPLINSLYQSQYTYIVKSIVVPPVYDPPLINSLYQSQYTYIVKSIVVPPIYNPPLIDSLYKANILTLSSP